MLDCGHKTIKAAVGIVYYVNELTWSYRCNSSPTLHPLDRLRIICHCLGIIFFY